jgi:hypothetical protein
MYTSSMTTTKSLPKTQTAALALLIDGMSFDEWNAAGANANAIPALVSKGIVRREGNRAAFETVRYFRVA